MNRPTVELVMIVRNGGSGLARCLKSALPAVDSILIGDTGSTDDSHQIAHDFGARTLDIPWENDFAKARNTVLTASHADWVLSISIVAAANWWPSPTQSGLKSRAHTRHSPATSILCCFDAGPGSTSRTGFMKRFPSESAHWDSNQLKHRS